MSTRCPTEVTGARWQGTVCEVLSSRNFLQRRSTARPNLLRKSMPIMGFWTSAMVKIKGNTHRKPRFRCNSLWPYVAIL
ncbi:unnamed protein product, partial [Dicrocoelium dendriticum]